ncbi:MAG: XrtN system VIT domain-containing protein [Leptospiraceae bacterium]|nr:XrtN system VIT domain-containing protein [Leptospiraceae bacterium]
MNVIKDWMTKPVSILGLELKRFIWFIICICILLLSILVFFGFAKSNLIHDNQLLFFSFIGALVIIVVFILISLLTFSHNFFILFVLGLSAVTFFVEKYLLEGAMFAKFSFRTTFLLWFCYSFMTIGLFYKKIPRFLLSLFPAIYLLGIYVCLGFMIILFPYMLIGWFFIIFAGLGFLAYSPVFAVSGFVKSFNVVLDEVKLNGSKKDKNTMYGTIAATVITLFSYTSWYAYEWKANSELLLSAKNSKQLGHEVNSIDLPNFLNIGMRLRKNHVTEQFLQPSNPVRGLSAFDTHKIFDPLSFLVSLTSHETSKAEFDQDKESILKLLFHYSHSELDRLWSGHSLVTKKVSSHVQLYLKEKVSYTETTIEVFNEMNSRQEAIYTLEAPEGSIATKLTLWINDKEEPSRLTLKSKAKKAYNEIVGREARDPSLLEWLSSGKFRLRVFPVEAKSSRKVKVGIFSFLTNEKDRYVYNSTNIIGVPFQNTEHEVYVDLFGEKSSIQLVGEGIQLKEKIVSDNQVRQWASSSRFNEQWKIGINTKDVSSIEGDFVFRNKLYSIHPKITKTIEMKPKTIYLALTNDINRSKWIEVYKKLRVNKIDKIYIVTNEIFHSIDESKSVAYLKEVFIPDFSIFPFHKLETHQEDILILTSSHKFSIPWTELRNTTLNNKIEKFFESKKINIFISTLGETLPEFYKSYEELGRITHITNTEEEFWNVLKEGKLSIPVNDESIIYLPANNSSIQISKSGSDVKKGNDFIARLAANRILLNQYGKSSIKDDTFYNDLQKIAEDAYLVSPISSLVVLETENDYERFGIKKNNSALGESNLNTPGLVPEPEEWFFALVAILALILYFYRSKAFYRN